MDLPTDCREGDTEKEWAALELARRIEVDQFISPHAVYDNLVPHIFTKIVIKLWDYCQSDR